MKRFYFTKLAIIIAAVFGIPYSGHCQTPTTIAYTGSMQTYTVTPGTFSVVVDMQGGKGGNGYSGYGNGGAGGRAQGTIATNPGDVLYLFVGGVGANSGGTAAGGFNGGGTSGTSGYGGGGGGASDIRIAGTALSNRVIIAAGGGGGGADCWSANSNPGGNGGGLTGTGGFDCGSQSLCTAGGGATQTAGGSGSTCYSGASGTLGSGSNGMYYGGGGGGGYYGGGGGAWGGGGGGSSYAHPTAVTGASLTTGYNTSGNGSIILTPICTPPLAGVITGNTNICGNGLTSSLSSTGSIGGIWTSSNPLVATVGSTTGVVTSVNTGTVTVSRTVTYSCGAPATATITVSVNPTPAPITGNGYICSATPSTLSDATLGGTWTSSNPSQATVGASSGTVTGLAVGNPLITYTVNTGCYRTITTTVNISPTLYTVTGGGAYCAGGTGVPVMLSSSSPGVSYQLYNGMATDGAPVTGTGTVLNFGAKTAAGTYTAVATSTASGCALTMGGSVNVTVNPVPTTFSVGGGGAYCAGGSGYAVTLSGSNTGINYQLFRGAATVGAPMPGTGALLNFGVQTTGGNYTVVATNPATGCSTSMSGSATITVDPLPATYTVTGGGSFCAGGSGVNVLLSNSQSGVNYTVKLAGVPSGSAMGGTGLALDFGPRTAPGTYIVEATDATTSCLSTMAGSAVISVNPVPTAYAVTGGGNYCTGGTGVHVGLSFSITGINYQLIRNGSPVGTPVSGTGSPLDFGLFTTPGTYTVNAVNATTGCGNAMTGAVVVTVSALPTVYNVGGGGNYCSGGTGLQITLDNSNTGINYQVYNGGSPVGGFVAGTGSAMNLGLQTLAGTYTVVAVNSATGCTSNMSGSTMITIDPLPTVYNVLGGGNYCAGGAGLNVTLSSSDINFEYQLYRNGVLTGAPMNGTGLALDFGAQTLAGTYTIIATNAVTATHCTSNMSGSAAITVNPVPAIFAVTGGGSYCAGGAGTHVGLSFSATSINYQIVLNGTPTGMPVSGTGTVLDLGLFSAPGTYTVVAANALTGCSSNMTGSVNVTINPLPAAHNVTGGGNYCAGGAGVHVGLDASNAGIRYQLFNATMPVGSPVIGTGGAIDYGMMTATGTYTVKATAVSSGCNSDMAGSANVGVTPLPTVYTVTGGGPFCAGGAGVDVSLNGSDAGVDYQLYVGGIPTGSMVSGTGGSISFGLQTTPGTYTVIGTDASYGCTNNMSGTATVIANALPSVFATTGGGSLCAGSAGVHIGIAGSFPGIAYQLLNGMTPAGSPMAGTGGALDLGVHTTAGAYTILATNTVTGCTNTMSGMATVVVNPLPTADTVSGGGAYCAGGSGMAISLLNSATGINYQLYLGTSTVGSVVPGSGTPLSFGTRTTTGTYTIVGINPVTGCRNTMEGNAVISVNPVAHPSVSLGSPAISTCDADTTTFMAATTDGGSAPSYVWTVNGLPAVGAVDAPSYVYVPANGDVVEVTLTSDAPCAVSPTTAAHVNVTVNPNFTPVVTVITDPGTTVCPGTPVLFTGSPMYGGLGATYEWTKNGAVTGTGITYSYVPANGDIVVCKMRSTYTCRTDDSVYSSNVVMAITPIPVPVITMTPSPVNHTILIGKKDTLTVTVANGGPSPTYQWYVNGAPVAGANSNVFISTFSNRDSVSCAVTASGPCGGETRTKSITINVYNNVGVQQVAAATANVSVMPNPNKGTFMIKGTMGNSNEEVAVVITNMLGQVVYSSNVMTQNGNISEQVQLGNLANGMYTLSLRSATERTVFHMVIEQ